MGGTNHSRITRSEELASRQRVERLEGEGKEKRPRDESIIDDGSLWRLDGVTNFKLVPEVCIQYDEGEKKEKNKGEERREKPTRERRRERDAVNCPRRVPAYNRVDEYLLSVRHGTGVDKVRP